MEITRIAHTPLTYIGWGSLQHLGGEIANARSKKIILVTDPVLSDIGLTSQIITVLEETGSDFDVYTKVIPEPLLDTAERLIHHVRMFDYDLVIGFGGGSVLDLAKLAAVMARHPGNVADYLNLTGARQIHEEGITKILIPTTAGTGSEVTNISVLSLGGTKDVISHDNLIGDIIIVDPQFTMTLPPRLTAATGMDALTHAIESYLSVNANPYSDSLALHAIRLIGSSLIEAVENGGNKLARTNMSYGSYLAGLAFFNAGVGGVHALAYPLGGQFHIPHGESNAVLLPYVMAYIRHSCSKKFADIFEALGEETTCLTDEEAGQKCVSKLTLLIQELGIPSTLKDLDIPESALESLAADGFKQKRLLARSPMSLTKEDIYRIYHSAFTGIIKGINDDGLS